MKRICYRLAFLVLAVVAFTMCTKKTTLLERHSAFDLEKVDFKENVNELFAKNLLDDNGQSYDSVDVTIINSDKQRYRITNSRIELLELKVPTKDLGFLYKSPTLDSVAKFQDTYFERVYLLTDNNKKPIGYYAEAELGSAGERNSAIEKLTEKYGKPTHAFFLAREFNQCSYEWVLADRTIQVETSFGFSSDINTNGGRFYKIDLLILENNAKKAVHEAHIFEYPEQIVYKGKTYSYKDMLLEKTEVFSDEFVLNSTKEYLLKNEHTDYDISLSPKDE
ncbi:hypothetical protein [Pedobacter ureilyticus]|uniref:Lipoprotein n=1 Tax=Pedobacter ureilyticus TaxID=1393051 RepID=A0ABW9J317_9SPHI|nr:hypothetical protein [Pedobacter helvus]